MRESNSAIFTGLKPGVNHFETGFPLRTADATATAAVAQIALDMETVRPRAVGLRREGAPAPVGLQELASPRKGKCRRVDPGCSIGIFASIRVEWWLAHADQ